MVKSQSQSLACLALDDKHESVSPPSVRRRAIARARLQVDTTYGGEPRVALEAVLGVAAATQQRITQTTWRLPEQRAAADAHRAARLV